jgi:hypothetical protein
MRRPAAPLDCPKLALGSWLWQEVNMRAAKYVLITLSLLAGVSFFYAGMGIDIPAVEFGNVASYGVPLGAALIVLAVVLAGFWRDSPSSSVKG